VEAAEADSSQILGIPAEERRLEANYLNSEHPKKTGKNNQSHAKYFSKYTYIVLTIP
jgi:hypothetical protein